MKTKRDRENQTIMFGRLRAAGIARQDCDTLRRISMTLRRWHELECGTGEGQISRSVERDEETGKPYLRIQFPTASGYVDRKYPTFDRETGALKRLETIMAQYPHLRHYVQTDPRGAALYILRRADVPEGESLSAHYPAGICVY